MNVIANLKYRAIELFDEDLPQFNYYIPTQSGDFYLVDCWIVDSKNNKHPNIDKAPIPINVTAFLR